MNDADSMCLSPKLPDYLYEEPDVLWSNVVWIESQGEKDESDRRRLPNVALQPPYFASRRTLAALLAMSFPYQNSFDGFIDHFMTRAAVESGIMWKGFHDGISSALSMNNNELQRAQVAVRHRGAVFIHGVKTPRFWQPLVTAHQEWINDYRAPGDHRPPTQRITTAGVKPADHEYVHSAMANNRITYSRSGDTPASPQHLQLLRQQQRQRRHQPWAANKSIRA